MAYRPEDIYNTGINTIGTDLGLGNIDQANNIELAKTFNTRQGLLDIGAAEKGWIGYNPTVVGDFIGSSKKLQGSQNPVTGGSDIGSIKTWMTDPKRQHIYEDYLDKSGTQFIPEIQKALEKGLFENKEDFGNQLLYKEAIKNKGDQAFLDDDKTPYDFSGIKGQTADLSGTFGVLSENADISRSIDNQVIDYENEYMKRTGKVPPPLYGEKKRMELQIKFLEMQKRKKEATTATTTATTAAKKKAVVEAAAKKAAEERRLVQSKKVIHDPGSGGSGGGGTWHRQTAAKEKAGQKVAGPGFGKGAYFRDGGLINFYKYGGFI